MMTEQTAVWISDYGDTGELLADTNVGKLLLSFGSQSMLLTCACHPTLNDKLDAVGDAVLGMKKDESMTPDEIADLEATHNSFGPPDGWMIVHSRASGSNTCHFGPFLTLVEAMTWWKKQGESKGVSPSCIPLYLDVDWSR